MFAAEKVKPFVREWFDKTEIETLTAIELIKVLDEFNKSETVNPEFGSVGEQQEGDSTQVWASVWGGHFGDEIVGIYTFSFEECFEYFILLKQEIALSIDEIELEKAWDEYLKQL
jgi:hypothetical protein